MDDNGGNITYYIVLAIIYLLSRIFGKKKKPVKSETVSRPVPRQRPGDEPIAPPTAAKEEPQPTFEDILRELTGASQPKPVSVPDPEPVAPPETFASREAYTTAEIDKIAGEPETIATGVERNREKYRSLKLERDNDYRIVEEEGIDFLDVLYEEDGPAKAVVMAEIFNRRY